MIVKSVMLPLAPAAAFELFTDRVDAWWPPECRPIVGPANASEIFLLPSGRFYERARDGREVELGAVRGWNRPDRILLDFFLGTSAEQPTEVEILFEPEPGGTRVTVTHRPKPSSAELWAAGAPRYERSWAIVFAALAQAAA